MMCNTFFVDCQLFFVDKTNPQELCIGELFLGLCDKLSKDNVQSTIDELLKKNKDEFQKKWTTIDQTNLNQNMLTYEKFIASYNDYCKEWLNKLSEYVEELRGMNNISYLDAGKAIRLIGICLINTYEISDNYNIDNYSSSNLDDIKENIQALVDVSCIQSGTNLLNRFICQNNQCKIGGQEIYNDYNNTELEQAINTLRELNDKKQKSCNEWKNEILKLAQDIKNNNIEQINNDLNNVACKMKVIAEELNQFGDNASNENQDIDSIKQSFSGIQNKIQNIQNGIETRNTNLTKLMEACQTIENNMTFDDILNNIRKSLIQNSDIKFSLLKMLKMQNTIYNIIRVNSKLDDMMEELHNLKKDRHIQNMNQEVIAQIIQSNNNPEINNIINTITNTNIHNKLPTQHYNNSDPAKIHTVRTILQGVTDIDYKEALGGSGSNSTTDTKLHESYFIPTIQSISSDYANKEISTNHINSKEEDNVNSIDNSDELNDNDIDTINNIDKITDIANNDINSESSLSEILLQILLEHFGKSINIENFDDIISSLSKEDIENIILELKKLKNRMKNNEAEIDDIISAFQDILTPTHAINTTDNSNIAKNTINNTINNINTTNDDLNTENILLDILFKTLSKHFDKTVNIDNFGDILDELSKEDIKEITLKLKNLKKEMNNNEKEINILINAFQRYM